MTRILTTIGAIIGILVGIQALIGRDTFLKLIIRFISNRIVIKMAVKTLVFVITGIFIAAIYIGLAFLAQGDFYKAPTPFLQIWWTDTYFGIFAGTASYIGARGWKLVKRIDELTKDLPKITPISVDTPRS